MWPFQTKLTNDEYRCYQCGGIFTKGWSDDDANAEAEKIFGVEKASTSECMVVICDDCWKKLPCSNHSS